MDEVKSGKFYTSDARLACTLMALGHVYSEPDTFIRNDFIFFCFDQKTVAMDVLAFRNRGVVNVDAVKLWDSWNMFRSLITKLHGGKIPH